METSSLSVVIFLPLAIGLLLSCSGKWLPGRVWQVLGFGATGTTFVLSIPFWTHYDLVDGGYQFIERVPWIEDYGIY
ncbi:MAG: hypothetical protein VX681_02270, partial [Myxococcota bacterium]|nr:hypothetical protein [Myxococcota bacterium]